MLSKGSALMVASKNINKEASANILMQKSFVYLYIKTKKFFNLGGFI